MDVFEINKEIEMYFEEDIFRKRLKLISNHLSSMMATSVSSERVFLLSSNIGTKQRSRFEVKI